MMTVHMIIRMMILYILDGCTWPQLDTVQVSGTHHVTFPTPVEAKIDCRCGVRCLMGGCDDAMDLML